MNNWIEYAIFYISLLPMFLLAFTPYFTRKSENFGVTIPLELYDRKDFQIMRRKFTLRMTSINIIFFISLIVVHFTLNIKTFTIFFTITILLLLLLFFIIYLPFHRQMKQIKQEENWVYSRKQQRIIDTDFRKANIVHSYGWYLIPFMLIVGTIIYTFIVYDSIPNQVPTHTSVDGVITYSNKSPGILMMLPFIQLFMLAIMIGSHYAIKISKQAIDASNPKQSKRHNKAFRRYWSMFLIITSIGITGLFTYIQLAMIHQPLLQYQDTIILLSVILLIVSLILLTLRTGQSGSRFGHTTEGTNDVMDPDEDHHWKLGQIYFNREDPTIFVEKRFGVGWTVNFARPIVWVLFIVLLLPLFIPLFL